MIITFEGLDGAGKATQTEKLIAHLKQKGLTVGQISFPRYKQTIHGHMIGDYLNGEFGDPTKIHHNLASVLFAQDRADSLKELNELIRSNTVVVIDRYTLSNAAYQAAKIKRQSNRDAFYGFIYSYEHSILNIPKANLVVYLDTEVATSDKLAKTRKKRDGHEKDLKYLKNVKRAYEEIFKDAPNFYDKLIWIKCTEKHKMRPIDGISKELCEEVDKYLESELTHTMADYEPQTDNITLF